MQGLKKANQNILSAKQLVAKAQNFTKEANFDYAIRCYDKAIILLKDSLQWANGIQTVEQIKKKIDQYLRIKEELKAKQLAKGNNVRTSFGFPQHPNNQMISQIKPIKIEELLPTKKQNDKIKINKVQRDPIFPQDIFNKETVKPKTSDKLKRQIKMEEIDPAIRDLIVHDINVSFKDIVGLKDVKQILEEAVIRPRKRPDLYEGIRAPPKGILLYGPPGNGKTFICKALSKQADCTFFALSASSILNKLVGESEKTIKKIFAAAQKLAPSIIFIDEIDSMLTARTQNQNDAARRLKTQFLVLMDGMTSPKSGDVLVIGATNLPQQLDAAAKRRFTKMVYIGHPDADARKQMLLNNLKQVPYDLTTSQISKVVDKLQFYSASQIRNIIAQACMMPLRQLGKSQFQKISSEDIRKVTFKDVQKIINERKPILTKEQLLKYKDKI